MNILADLKNKETESILEDMDIDVESLLENLRFEYQHSSNYLSNSTAFGKTNDTGEWIMSCCPNHTEHRASFGVSKEPPYRCNCFYCGYLGTIDEVIELSLDLGEGEGLKKLLSDFVVEIRRKVVNVVDIIENLRDPHNIGVLPESALDSFIITESEHFVNGREYLYSRGLSDKTLSTYGIGVDIQNNCIVFPQRTRAGELRFIQKRKIGNYFSGAKFINEGNAVKKDILFGLHLIDKLKYTPNRIKRIRLVESPIDVLSNYQAGFAAVAINGKLLFKNQVMELQLAGIEVVDVMLDNDLAGFEGTKKAAKTLDKAGFTVNIVSSPKYYKDANDMLRAGCLRDFPVINNSLIKL